MIDYSYLGRLSGYVRNEKAEIWHHETVAYAQKLYRAKTKFRNIASIITKKQGFYTERHTRRIVYYYKDAIIGDYEIKSELEPRIKDLYSGYRYKYGDVKPISKEEAINLICKEFGVKESYVNSVISEPRRKTDMNGSL